MNVFLMTDIEGVPGIDSLEQIDREKDTYRDACAILEHSINLTVAACFDNGADRVYYLDGHAGGGNVLPSNIDSRAQACTIAQWQELVRAGQIDCVIELGAHARGGTIGGFLDHTLSSKVVFLALVNGMEMCELSLHAALCAKYGVPTVAVIGDETVCQQVKSYIPDIVAGPVKKAISRNRAETYPDADRILQETVAKALARYDQISLFQLAEPVQVEYIYTRTDYCESILARCGSEVRRVDARTLQKTVSAVTYYEDLKIL